MTTQEIKNRPIRVNATISLPKGSKAILGQGNGVTQGYVWIDLESFYGYSPITIFLPDFTPREKAEQIVALFNEVLALPVEEDVSCD